MNGMCEVDVHILVMAFRYALGRMTYAPTHVIDNIKRNIDNIPSHLIEVIIKEIKECDRLGMDVDIKTWEYFQIWLLNYLQKRG